MTQEAKRVASDSVIGVTSDIGLAERSGSPAWNLPAKGGTGPVVLPGLEYSRRSSGYLKCVGAHRERSTAISRES